VTEAEARAALAAFAGFDNLEQWIAGEPWHAAPDGGWTVLTDLDGWHFRLRPVPGGLRVSAFAPGGWRPAVWQVPG
jgi:hypothetical protein